MAKAGKTKKKAVRDLTRAQNEALRPLVDRAIGIVGSQTRLADSIGWSQSGVASFLGGRQGTSIEKALKICALVGADPAKLLGLRLNGAQPALTAPLPEMPSGVFYGKLQSLPKLTNELVLYPDRWQVVHLVTLIKRLLEDPGLITGAGDLASGTWRAALDEIAGNVEPTERGGRALLDKHIDGEFARKKRRKRRIKKPD